MNAFVAYYRLSKKTIDQQYLGLDAQRSIVENYCQAHSGNVIATFSEIQSGKNDNRVELNKAIAFAKENSATLLIAKLDRLSRNVAFIFTLRDSGVEFVACDLPEANTLTIGILAAFAQHERERISERTKSALAAKKKNGWIKNVVSNVSDETRKKAVASVKQNALDNDNNKRAKNYVLLLRQQKNTLDGIASKLNTEGFKTARGKEWGAEQVRRML